MLDIKISTFFKHYKLIIKMYKVVMKTISTFILLVYWSLIILAPVLAKNINQESKVELIKPVKKPRF